MSNRADIDTDVEQELKDTIQLNRASRRCLARHIRAGIVLTTTRSRRRRCGGSDCFIARHGVVFEALHHCGIVGFGVDYFCHHFNRRYDLIP